MTRPVPPTADPREHVVALAATDPDFRRQLLAHPKAALRRALGINFPSGLEISVIEEAPRHIYIVLPMLAPAGQELTDEQLDEAAGGALAEAFPMRADLPEPLPMPADLPGPMPAPTLTFTSLYLRQRRRQE